MDNPEDNGYQVLLFYLYTSIADPRSFAIEQRAFGQVAGLRGRVWVAEEGINGTLSGTIAATEAYEAFLRQQPGCALVDCKKERCTGHLFAKWQVKVKEELVTWRLRKPLDPREDGGTYLTPFQFYQAMRDEDVLLLDGRNGYEYDLGHFRGAIRAPVDTTREFPVWLQQRFRVPKDRPIVTYCTGGVRCEKLTAWLRKAGHTQVAQLQGGIICYAQDSAMRGKGFLGLCYVFDQRHAIPINTCEPHTVVGRCKHCSAATEQHIHRTHEHRHAHQHLICPACR